MVSANMIKITNNLNIVGLKMKRLHI